MQKGNPVLKCQKNRRQFVSRRPLYALSSLYTRQSEVL